MCAFLQPKLAPHAEGSSHTNGAAGEPGSPGIKPILVVTQDIFTGYVSELEDDSYDDDLTSFYVRDAPTAEEEEIGSPGEENGKDFVNEEWEDVSEGPFRVNDPLALKRRRHDVPVCIA